MLLRKFTGVVLLQLALVGLAAPHAAGQNLFFGSIGRGFRPQRPDFLFTCDLNGGGLTSILPTPGAPVGLDVDPTVGRVFWQDQMPYPGTVPSYWEVRSASLTGASPTVLAHINSNGSYGLAVDTVNQRVYWCNGLSITRTDYNGSNPLTVATNVFPQAIEVDPANGKIFWCDRGTANNPSIASANLDGTNPQTLLTLATNSYPAGITVNPTTQTIYWSDYTGGTISTLAYSGGASPAVYSALPGPAGLDLELTTNRLYIVDRNGGTVRWGLPSGGPLTTVYAGTAPNVGEMWDIAVIVPEPHCGLLLLTVGAALIRHRRQR